MTTEDVQGDPLKARIDELATQLEGFRSEVADLSSAEAPTDEQIARMDELIPTDADKAGLFDTAQAEYDKLVARAEKVEAVRTASLKTFNREAGFGAPNVVDQRDAFEDVTSIRAVIDTEGNARMGSDDVIERAVRAFSETRQRGVKPEHIEALIERVETIPGAAEHVLVHGSPAYRSAFNEYMRSQGQNPMYTTEEAATVRASMSLTNANGGFTIPTLLDPTIIHTGNATKNPIRDIARVVEGTVNTWNGVSAGNVTSYWTAEGAVFTEGSPTFANPSVTAKKLTAYLEGTFEVFEDSSLQSQMPGLIDESFSYAEGTAFVVGNGTTQPLGIVTAISATAGSTVTATTRGSFTTASGVDVFALLGSLPSRYEDSSTWVANKSFFNIVKQMPAGAGATTSIWPDFAAGTGAELLQSPIRKASDMSNATTSGTVLAILGDFSQFVIYDRIGTQVEFIQNVIDQATGLPNGKRALVAHKRVGSNVTDVNAFRFLKA